MPIRKGGTKPIYSTKHLTAFVNEDEKEQKLSTPVRRRRSPVEQLSSKHTKLTISEVLKLKTRTEKLTGLAYIYRKSKHSSTKERVLDEMKKLDYKPVMSVEEYEKLKQSSPDNVEKVMEEVNSFAMTDEVFQESKKDLETTPTPSVSTPSVSKLTSKTSELLSMEDDVPKKIAEVMERIDNPSESDALEYSRRLAQEAKEGYVTEETFNRIMDPIEGYGVEDTENMTNAEKLASGFINHQKFVRRYRTPPSRFIRR